MPPRTGSTRRTHTNTNNANTDFKTLTILYRQQIPTLRELFPGWSQEDLVAAMHEANGDLELTIGRIMEGHANQWDKVKTKKPKPHQKQTGTTDNKTDEPNGNKDVSRGAKSRNGRSRSKYSNKSQGHVKESLKSVEKEKKPSWASILKGPIKTESLVSSEKVQTTTLNDHSKTMEPDDSIKENTADNTTDPPAIPVEPATKTTDLTADILTQTGDTATETEEYQKETDATIEQLISTKVAPIPEPHITTLESQQIISFRKVPVRRLKQDEPVVLPGGGLGLENVSMQFGSLNLAGGEEEPISKVQHTEEPIQDHHHEQSEKQTLTATTTPVPSTATSLNITTQADTSSSTKDTTTIGPEIIHPSKTTDTNVYKSQRQPPAQPQPQIHQYQQSIPLQYQQFSTEAQINSYAPYPSGNEQLHSFVNTGMIAMPDYSDYQRPTSYYDPNAYSQSPSIDNANLYGRAKISNGQEGMTPSPMTVDNTSSTIIIPQQPQTGYGRNTGGYYPYYYMPNQHQTYYQNGYQQQLTSQPQVHQQPAQASHMPSGPYYGKQTSSSNQDYAHHQQLYDEGTIHGGSMYDKPFNSVPHQQTYLNRNLQPKDLMMSDKQQYQPHYQDYQPPQAYLYQQQQPYNPNNGYRQNQPQQTTQYWYQV